MAEEQENKPDELDDYISRCKKMSPSDILKYLGELRDFIYNNMTAEGKEIFNKSRTVSLEKTTKN